MRFTEIESLGAPGAAPLKAQPSMLLSGVSGESITMIAYMAKPAMYAPPAGTVLNCAPGRQMQSRDKNRNEMVVALRFQSKTREILRVSESSGNFYVFLHPTRTLSGWHYSYHASGQRHVRVETNGRRQPALFVSHVQPTSDFHGVELILGGSVLKGLFCEFPECARSQPGTLVFDADTARFRDDEIFVRIFLVEPGVDTDIPNASDVGPKLLRVVKTTNPWIGIAFFQQKTP